jgi:diadenosine tetraphosphate (Ap4A) HIT family hydrolase
MSFTPPQSLIVHETPHWRVNQRLGCSVPGYLIVGAKAADALELPDLSPQALAELEPQPSAGD